MTKLILRYATVVALPDPMREALCETPVLALVRAYSSHVGDMQFFPGRPITAPKGDIPMEGMQLLPGSGIDPAALRYRSRRIGADWDE